MERREPGSRWTRAGGAAGRRRAGLAGARARGGPRARACRGRRGSRTPGPPAASRPACSSARLPGDRRSRLPPSPLPAGPRPGGARSHPRPKPPSRRALRTGARKLPPAGTLRRVPEPGRAGPPADRPLYWVTGLAHRPAGRSHLGGRAARGPRPIPRPAPDTLRMTKELEIHININWSRLTQTMRILPLLRHLELSTAPRMQQNLNSVPRSSATAPSFFALAFSEQNSASCWNHYCKLSIKENKPSFSYPLCSLLPCFSQCSRLVEAKEFPTEEVLPSYTICSTHFNFIKRKQRCLNSEH
ncbi:uncharacterized protein [Chlorocebus sabaeus]|uniref:uncharacterized protein n=1 Tax=Chlorocebus sabaeus TaxID=60711 RepID=UPI003BF9813C